MELFCERCQTEHSPQIDCCESAEGLRGAFLENNMTIIALQKERAQLRQQLAESQADVKMLRDVLQGLLDSCEGEAIALGFGDVKEFEDLYPGEMRGAREALEQTK